jgi:hypothetical protein
MDEGRLHDVLQQQQGVVARRQVVGLGGSDNDIERMIRRRAWARVHTGVYVAHNGPMTPQQRTWAALLRYWPAALAGVSAFHAYGLGIRPATDGIEVAVDADRRFDRVAGIRVHRLTDFSSVALLHLSPPRLPLEHAVLTVASRSPTEDGAVALISDACQTRRTTVRLLVAALVSMPRLPRRALLLPILEDVATGAYSVLERRYLTRVERPHGLPTARRQRWVRPVRKAGYRDVDYLGLRTVVELDGRLGHEWTADKWADLDRDIDSAVAGDLTLRAGWRQVLEPCRLATGVARVLLARGWNARPHGCRPGCPVGDIGGFPAPGPGNPPLSRTAGRPATSR